MFQGTSSLMMHERSHIADRIYKCLECWRTYHSLSDFHVHQRSHAGEKPHRCPVDCVRCSGRNGPLSPAQVARLAEKFGFESGEEEKGPVVSAQEVQPEALLPQSPQGGDGEVGPDELPGETAGAPQPSVPAGDSGKDGATQDSAEAQGDDGEVGPDELPGEPAGAPQSSVPAVDSGKDDAIQDSTETQGPPQESQAHRGTMEKWDQMSFLENRHVPPGPRCLQGILGKKTQLRTQQKLSVCQNHKALWGLRRKRAPEGNLASPRCLAWTDPLVCQNHKALWGLRRKRAPEGNLASPRCLAWTDPLELSPEEETAGPSSSFISLRFVSFSKQGPQEEPGPPGQQGTPETQCLPEPQGPVGPPEEKSPRGEPGLPEMPGLDGPPVSTCPLPVVSHTRLLPHTSGVIEGPQEEPGPPDQQGIPETQCLPEPEGAVGPPEEKSPRGESGLPEMPGLDGPLGPQEELGPLAQQGTPETQCLPEPQGAVGPPEEKSPRGESGLPEMPGLDGPLDLSCPQGPIGYPDPCGAEGVDGTRGLKELKQEKEEEGFSGFNGDVEVKSDWVSVPPLCSSLPEAPQSSPGSPIPVWEVLLSCWAATPPDIIPKARWLKWDVAVHHYDTTPG
ncbi:UNVERIFIED_CONTAM: hypothetical protein K2H54_066767 [Gekko kuhli]